jgi:hypothetical protein
MINRTVSISRVKRTELTVRDMHESGVVDFLIASARTSLFYVGVINSSCKLVNVSLGLVEMGTKNPD